MTLRTAESALAARARIRSGDHVGPTSGLAPGFAQANLVVLPAEDALDFVRFCLRNPKPCPLLEVTDTGSPQPTSLAPDADLRTDLPLYRVFRAGEFVDEPTDVTRYWRDDLVGFLLGCSFTFEWALAAAGLHLAHQAQGVNVPMYVTNRRCVSAGPFEGPMVVSMRPFKPADAIRAVQITSRFPSVHGAPVHLGHPHSIGIADINKPDYGDAVPIAADEIPVFWACGVTPQSVIAAAKVPFAITHSPGLMLVTDLQNKSLAVL